MSNTNSQREKDVSPLSSKLFTLKKDLPSESTLSFRTDYEDFSLIDATHTFNMDYISYGCHKLLDMREPFCAFLVNRINCYNPSGYHLPPFDIIMGHKVVPLFLSWGLVTSDTLLYQTNNDYQFLGYLKIGEIVDTNITCVYSPKLDGSNNFSIYIRSHIKHLDSNDCLEIQLHGLPWS